MLNSPLSQPLGAFKAGQAGPGREAALAAPCDDDADDARAPAALFLL